MDAEGSIVGNEEVGYRKTKGWPREPANVVLRDHYSDFSPSRERMITTHVFLSCCAVLVITILRPL